MNGGPADACSGTERDNAARSPMQKGKPRVITCLAQRRIMMDLRRSRYLVRSTFSRAGLSSLPLNTSLKRYG